MALWRKSISSWVARRFSNLSRSTLPLDDVNDEGDWFYSSEWLLPDSKGKTVFRSCSEKGNGIVSVIAFPSSRPNAVYWPVTENWLQERYAEFYPTSGQDEKLRILHYQWRLLRFNDDTYQSAVKLLAGCLESKPDSVFLMQQPHCLAVPYLRSLVASGFTALLSSGYDFTKAAHGECTMRILCIGHGGGSLPLFLAHKIQGAIIDIVEIDPLVITASVEAMGFPSFSVRTSKPDPIADVLWRGIHERLFLHESEPENFLYDSTDLYDIVFIDAYDGDDLFPPNLWDPQFPFLKVLESRLHTRHGTVVVNLHTHKIVSGVVMGLGQHMREVSQAYMDAVLGCDRSKGSFGVGFRVSAPYLCNSVLVVSRGFKGNGGGGVFDRGLVMNTLMSKCCEVERALDLQFSCLGHIKTGFTLLD